MGRNVASVTNNTAAEEFAIRSVGRIERGRDIRAAARRAFTIGLEMHKLPQRTAGPHVSQHELR